MSVAAIHARLCHKADSSVWPTSGSTDRPERKDPQRVDHYGEGLVGGKTLQPRGHRRDRHERRRDEGQREDPNQAERLDGFLVLDGQPDVGRDAANGETEELSQHDHPKAPAAPPVKRNPTR